MDNVIQKFNLFFNTGQPSINQRCKESSGSFQKTFDSILNSRKNMVESKGFNSSEAKSKKAYSALSRDTKLTRDSVKKDEELSDADVKNPLVKTLSDILGIDPGDVIAILKLSGNNISMESTLNCDKIAQDISGLLGLDSRQQKHLSELINLAADISTNQAYSKDKSLLQNIENASVSGEESIDLNIVWANDSGSLQSSTRETDDAILYKQLTTESGVLSELKQKIEALLSDSKTQDALDTDSYLEKALNPVNKTGNLSFKVRNLQEAGVSNENDAVSIDEVSKVLEAETREVTEKSDDKNATDNSSESFQDDSRAIGTKQINELLSDNNEFLQASENTQSGPEINPQIQALQASTPYSRTSFSEITGSSIKTIDPYSNEILSQIVEKASVVLDEGKSEMIMNLKPDNLGKLELKVVTERGIVAANFLAESQQVKEIIESNMQLLKDALEKQGLSVQGFSVSVRQDSGQGADTNNNNTYSRQGLHSGRSSLRNVSNTSAAGSLSERLNPYSYDYSKIDYIA